VKKSRHLRNVIPGRSADPAFGSAGSTRIENQKHQPQTQDRGLRYQPTSVAAQNETMETSETNETHFLKSRLASELGCGKKSEIPPISKKCYFLERSPILKLNDSSGALANGPKVALGQDKGSAGKKSCNSQIKNERWVYTETLQRSPKWKSRLKP
jgi:hypothetical protein